MINCFTLEGGALTPGIQVKRAADQSGIDFAVVLGGSGKTPGNSITVVPLSRNCSPEVKGERIFRAFQDIDNEAGYPMHVLSGQSRDEEDPDLVIVHVSTKTNAQYDPQGISFSRLNSIERLNFVGDSVRTILKDEAGRVRKYFEALVVIGTGEACLVRPMGVDPSDHSNQWVLFRGHAKGSEIQLVSYSEFLKCFPRSRRPPEPTKFKPAFSPETALVVQ